MLPPCLDDVAPLCSGWCTRRESDEPFFAQNEINERFVIGGRGDELTETGHPTTAHEGLEGGRELGGSGLEVMGDAINGLWDGRSDVAENGGHQHHAGGPVRQMKGTTEGVPHCVAEMNASTQKGISGQCSCFGHAQALVEIVAVLHKGR